MLHFIWKLQWDMDRVEVTTVRNKMIRAEAWAEINFAKLTNFIKFKFLRKVVASVCTLYGWVTSISNQKCLTYYLFVDLLKFKFPLVQ